MQINSLEQMEKIVKENKTLLWDGWTVVNSYPSYPLKFEFYLHRYNLP